MELYELIFIALLGASFGSFANVLIYRIPLGISIIKPNSFCPNCKSKIKFYHNIPIISWILLKQKCANCGTKITFSYPLVEILSTTLIFIIYFKEQVHIVFLPYFAISSFFLYLTFLLLLVMSAIDIKYKAIKDNINFTTLFFAIISSNSIWDNFQNALVMAGGITLLRFAMSSILNKEAMGEADIIIIATLGALLGVNGALAALFIGSIIALPFALFMQYFKNDEELPFIPFLAIGAFVEYLYEVGLGFVNLSLS